MVFRMDMNLSRGQWVYNRTMTNTSVIRVRVPALLDTVTYISLVVMALLGASRLSTLNFRLAALGLCLIFGLLYRFVFHSWIYEKFPAVYFGAQLIVMVFLLSLGPKSTDSFNFLYLLTCIHATLTLTRKTAVMWVLVYFGTVSASALIASGTNGFFAVAFYVAAYAACSLFGAILQQAELAREHNQRLIEELKSTQKKLQELAVVDERNRLARELHDSVKQQVFAISMQLSAAKTSLTESDKAFASVTQAERLAQQAGAELTTLIHELRPPSLERKNLSAALKEYVLDWSLQNDVAVEAKVEEELSALENVEQALFRVAQEALSNVARHSNASKVSVTLAGKNDEIILTVEDNGAGFDSEDETRGVGLASMRERLESVGGRLDLTSQRKKGTRVVARARRS